jgi:hypothetical protein
MSYAVTALELLFNTGLEVPRCLDRPVQYAT